MKTALFLAALLASVTLANAGTVTFSVAETGQPTATKVYTVPDADIDRLIRAYQSPANVSINGTASRAQVLLFWVQGFIAETTQTIQAFETPVPVTPAPIVAQ